MPARIARIEGVLAVVPRVPREGRRQPEDSTDDHEAAECERPTVITDPRGDHDEHEAEEDQETAEDE